MNVQTDSPRRVYPSRAKKKETHHQRAYRCVGGPLDGEVHMVRSKIGEGDKPVRMLCDKAALLKGMRGFYRSIDHMNLHWVNSQ